MHGLDRATDVGCDCSRCADMRRQVTQCNSCSPSVIDIHPIRRRRRQFVTIERRVGFQDCRPRGRVRCRFPGEVAGIELRAGSVDVTRVEKDGRRDPILASISKTRSSSLLNGSGAGSRPEKHTRSSRRRSPGRDDSRRQVFESDVRGGPKVCDVLIPTAMNARADHPPAIVSNEVFGHHRGGRGPVFALQSKPEHVPLLGVPCCQVSAPVDEVPQTGQRDIEL